MGTCYAFKVSPLLVNNFKFGKFERLILTVFQNSIGYSKCLINEVYLHLSHFCLHC